MISNRHHVSRCVSCKRSTLDGVISLIDEMIAGYYAAGLNGPADSYRKFIEDEMEDLKDRIREIGSRHERTR